MAAQKKPLSFDIGRSPPAQISTASREKEQRQQVGARVTTATYRQLKARAALQGASVQTLVEQAITEFLANHPD